MQVQCECPQTAEEFFDGLRVSCMMHISAARRGMMPEDVMNTPVDTLSGLALTLVEHASFGDLPHELVDTLECLAREIEEAHIRRIVPVRALVSMALSKAEAMVRDTESRRAVKALDKE